VRVFLRATKVAEGHARDSGVNSGPLAACSRRRALPDTAMNLSATPGIQFAVRSDPVCSPKNVTRYALGALWSARGMYITVNIPPPTDALGYLGSSRFCGTMG
jgi:hypothetical protein